MGGGGGGGLGGAGQFDLKIRAQNSIAKLVQTDAELKRNSFLHPDKKR